MASSWQRVAAGGGGAWQRAAAARAGEESTAAHPPRHQLRVGMAGAAAIAIVLAAVLAVISDSPVPARTGLAQSGNWLQRMVAHGKNQKGKPQARGATGPGLHVESEAHLSRDAYNGAQREASADAHAYAERPGGSSAAASSAHYTELYDGTPASRFDPVSEHAAAYNPTVSGQLAYHVARLTGVDADGSSQMCGRAEVKHDGRWGSICFRGFTQTDAEMFCKTMGLTGGNARYTDSSGKPTWDDTVITHRDLTAAHVMQRREYGQGTSSDPPLQPDVSTIWMSEVQCSGNEANILDCPFGGKPGEGALPESLHQTWVDYATLEDGGCDETSAVGLCCSVSQFCPPRSTWVPDSQDYAHQGQMFGSTMRPEQMVPEMVANCKCDAGFYMDASTVYSGRCKSCPAGSCSHVGATSVDQCFCLEGFHRDDSGGCSACPAHACSRHSLHHLGPTGIEDCQCFEGYYMSGGECVLCPEGKTSLAGSTSEAECDTTCGLPHSSEAGDNAQAVVAAAADVAAADAAQKSALIPYIQAVNDENKAQAALVVAQAFVPPSPAAYMSSVQSSTHYSGWSDIGNHKTHYLDRQSLDCGAGALTGFGLQRSGGSIRYKFTCTNNAVFLEGSQSVSTASQDDGNGDLYFLDRLWVDCGAIGALSQFRYVRDGGNRGLYQYSCKKPNNLLQCENRYTAGSDDGGGGSKIEFLDRQYMSCNYNEVMRGFGMQRINGGINYRYICCRLAGSADAGFQSQLSAAVAANAAEISHQQSVIAEAQSVTATAKSLYETEASKRAAAVDVLKPLLAISTEEQTNAHFETAKNRCQPHLLCTQSACNGRAPATPCTPWPSCYPHPCHPWPACASKLPSGGYENGELKPLTPAGRSQSDVDDVLKSYDAAAGYDADPAAGPLGATDRVERGSTGPEAFDHEFDQR